MWKCSTHRRTGVSTRTSSSSNTSGTLMKERRQPFQIMKHSCDFKSTRSTVLTASPEGPGGPAGPAAPVSPFPPAGPRSPLAPVWPSAPCRGITVLYVQEIYAFQWQDWAIAHLQLREQTVSENYRMSYRGSSESWRSSRSNLSTLTLWTDGTWSIRFFILAEKYLLYLIHVNVWF